MSESNLSGAPSGAPFFFCHVMPDSEPDPAGSLDVSAIAHRFKSCLIGSDIRFYPSIDSTNRIARELAADSWRNGTVIWTDFQSAGRGRRGRSWQAPPASALLLSVMLSPNGSTLPQVAVMPAALAVKDAIRETAGVEVSLKWPNDVVYARRKVCGILAEVMGPAGDQCVIVGIGINVNKGLHSESFPDTALTLEEIVGYRVRRQDLALALVEHLNLWYGIFTEDQDTVLRAWSSSLHIAGKDVAVHDISGMWMGTVMDIQPDGALRVRDPEGVTRSVYAADVSIREPGDFTGF